MLRFYNIKALYKKDLINDEAIHKSLPHMLNTIAEFLKIKDLNIKFKFSDKLEAYDEEKTVYGTSKTPHNKTKDDYIITIYYRNIRLSTGKDNFLKCLFKSCMHELQHVHDHQFTNRTSEATAKNFEKYYTHFKKLWDLHMEIHSNLNDKILTHSS